MSGPGFKDHFSGHAAEYAAARPTYPAALFDWLTTLAPRDATVLECGCGNGQASLELAERFARVVATDPSAQQLELAPRHPRIEYRVAPAEASGLPDASVGLVTAAQAVHWFDHARFAAECRRVLVPGGAVVAWCYGLNRIAPEVDAVTDRLYGDEFTGPYWHPERRHIDEGLRTIPWPFAELEVPRFTLEQRWTLPQYLAYLRTWSAVKGYEKARGRDPVAEVEPDYRRAWGDPAVARTLRFRFLVRAGTI